VHHDDIILRAPIGVENEEDANDSSSSSLDVAHRSEGKKKLHNPNNNGSKCTRNKKKM
jgi:hypothetical protein